MFDAGVRNIIDLRNPDEVERRETDPVAAELPGIGIQLLPVEDHSDPKFQTILPILDSPESIWPLLRTLPEKIAAVYRAVALAEGAVVIHCAGGCDRSGMITMGLLQLAGVSAEEIADDYEAGVRAIAHYDPTFGELKPGETNQQLDDWVAHTRGAMLDAVAEASIEEYLLAAGLQASEIAAIRSKLLTP